MDGNSFINAFMPTLPWWFLVISLVTAWAFLARAWIRRWNAQRRQVENPGKALAIARDALATVISDPLAREDTRKQAVDAYDAVTVAISTSKRSEIR